MATPSTVPTAKQRIVDALKARGALNTVTITVAPPTELEDEQADLIYFTGTTARTPSWQILGSGSPLDEDYTITLKIDTVVDGDDSTAAEARAYALLDEVESALRAAPTLTNLLIPSTRGNAMALGFGEQSITLSPRSNAWRAEATVPLLCHARIP